jgi:tRNA G46 methylase TrmB
VNKTKFDGTPENLLMLRADARSFWRLLRNADFKAQKHYLLYPNPWPKKKHLQLRWHGSTALTDLLALGGELELRSNWKTYLEEFKIACEIAKDKYGFKKLKLQPINIVETDDQAFPISLFEKKYHESQHELYRLTVSLG